MSLATVRRALQLAWPALLLVSLSGLPAQSIPEAASISEQTTRLALNEFLEDAELAQGLAPPDVDRGPAARADPHAGIRVQDLEALLSVASADQRARLERLLRHPIYPNGSQPRELRVPGRPASIWYDARRRSDLVAAKALSKALSGRIWARAVSLSGGIVPQGVGPRLQIYLIRGTDINGETTCLGRKTVKIAIDLNETRDPSSPPRLTNALIGTLAHEFWHAIQCQAAWLTLGAWHNEATATWAVDAIYPNLDHAYRDRPTWDHEQGYAPHFDPTVMLRPSKANDVNNLYAYGSYLFFSLLADRWPGEAVVARVSRALAANGNDLIGAIKVATSSERDYETLASFLPDFAAATWSDHPDRQLKDRHGLPVEAFPTTTASTRNIPSIRLAPGGSPIDTFAVEPLASSYRRYLPGENKRMVWPRANLPSGFSVRFFELRNGDWMDYSYHENVIGTQRLCFGGEEGREQVLAVFTNTGGSRRTVSVRVSGTINPGNCEVSCWDADFDGFCDDDCHSSACATGCAGDGGDSDEDGICDDIDDDVPGVCPGFPCGDWCIYDICAPCDCYDPSVAHLHFNLDTAAAELARKRNTCASELPAILDGVAGPIARPTTPAGLVGKQ